MASILAMCQGPPAADSVTVLEKDGEMKDTSSFSATIPELSNYPEVTIGCDMTCLSSQRENVKSAFIPKDKNVWQRAFHAWHDVGMEGSFEEIVKSKDEVGAWTLSISSGILGFLKGMHALNNALFPHLTLSTVALLNKFAEITDWFQSPVHAFSWHSHTTKLAVALEDDSIQVYTAGMILVPVLKHRLQKSVSCLAWQPFSASVLAVGCQTCILIWHVEPTSLAARPSSAAAQVLQFAGHAPVTQLSWDPLGMFLISACPTDTAIIVWEISTETCTSLRRFGGGGICLLSWSPQGNRVMAASSSPLFRVWDTEIWNCEVWSRLPGRVTAACWSHDGQTLLVATEVDSVIHSVKFPGTKLMDDSVISAKSSFSGDGASTALSVVDVREVVLPDTNGKNVKVGGYIQQMVWNKTSERLAILFRGEDGKISPFIGIFKTSLHPVIQIIPSGFIKGRKGEMPHHIAFQPSFNKGALLSVVWSSGRVAYIPMYFWHEEQAGGFQVQPSTVNGHGIRQLYTSMIM